MLEQYLDPPSEIKVCSFIAVTLDQGVIIWPGSLQREGHKRPFQQERRNKLWKSAFNLVNETYKSTSSSYYLQTIPFPQATWTINNAPLPSTSGIFVSQLEQAIVLLNIDKEMDSKVIRAWLISGYGSEIFTQTYVIRVNDPLVNIATYSLDLFLPPKDASLTLKDDQPGTAIFECVFNARYTSDFIKCHTSSVYIMTRHMGKYQVYCEGFLPCPQTGQWCSWSPAVQQCTRSCGTRGMGLRSRQCACPKPSHGGSDCEIPPEVEKLATSLSNDNTTDAPTELAFAAILKAEGLWEPCNRHHCPYLRTLDIKENSLISEDLKLQKAEDTWILSSGILQKISGPIKLFCPPSRISHRGILGKPDRFPKSKFYWTRSTPTSPKEPYDTPGIPIVNTDLYLLENDYLVIRRLESATVGIYRFGYEYEPGYFETACFFSVYIRHWQQVLKHGVTFDLVCNSLGLWPIISRSTTTKWFIYWNITLLEKNVVRNTMKKHKLWWYTELNNFHINSIDKQTNSSQFTMWDTEYRRLYDVIKTMTEYYECQVLNQINATFNRTFILHNQFIL
ncbi:hypothetical protein MN116_001295 [Schistosoma mekongi]|uniref:Uncharacterized protein n=1 Tax=Schistosoma mekongi TaxID=38744 RepID=A0AAE1ZM95_SCHME|nr:hypothetical protein MN116_001295 [Schistosoma mekongi]